MFTRFRGKKKIQKELEFFSSVRMTNNYTTYAISTFFSKIEIHMRNVHLNKEFGRHFGKCGTALYSRNHPLMILSLEKVPALPFHKAYWQFTRYKVVKYLIQLQNKMQQEFSIFYLGRQFFVLIGVGFARFLVPPEALSIKDTTN